VTVDPGNPALKRIDPGVSRVFRFWTLPSGSSSLSFDLQPVPRHQKMSMKLLVALGLVFAFAPCLAASPNDDVVKVAESFYAQYYKEYLHKPAKGNSDKALIRWVAANPNLSDTFKQGLRQTLLDARKAEPEMGLGYDPILMAQDYPDKGYRAKDIQVTGDKASLVMEGIDAPDFKILVKLVNSANKWKIDSIGEVPTSPK
jgi:hypothetical protein